MRIQLELKIEDCWVGVFWKPRKHWKDMWICIVPCIPIHLTR